ncbi:MAG: hypothetical protein JXK95_14075 [Bacteroidales bacterium]|nr:hypothetical protein [Bacteroidales bacterium]
MISFYRKYFFLRVRQNWFTCNCKLSDIFSLKAYVFVKNIEHEKIWGIKRISYTIENSLVPDKDVIFSGFKSSTKYDIRRAEKEGIDCYFHEDIDAFVKFYNAFAKERKIPPTSRQRMIEMGENLKLSFALFKGQVLSAHSYVVDKDIGVVRFYQSASLRFDSHFDPAKIGRSNKLLQYKDMLYFKKKGFKIFDFGGYTENTRDKGLIGINQYKLSFGGKITTCYSCYSIGYYIIMRLAELLELLRR